MLAAAPLILFSLSSFFSYSTAQGLGTDKCADSGLDWYTSTVGETPCKTYERLRKICNNNYQVGKLNTNTPPDVCDEQVASCCCNNIAFSLSMLCLNCQQPIGSGSGFDAGKDAYQIYLNAGRANNAFCSPQQNKTLPTDIQSAVCNQNIKIYDDLYNIFWGDGTWFYTFTSQTITKDQNADPNKIFTKCPKQSSSGTPSSTGSTSPSSTSNDQSSDNQASSSGIGTGAIVGIAVGVVVLAIAGALAGFFFVRRRRRAQYVNASGLNIDDDGPQGPPPPAPNPYPYTPSGVTSPVSGPGSDPAMSQYNAPSTATGSYFPPASVPGRSSHSESGQPLSTSYYGSASGSQTGSGSGVSGASTAPFVVSNPDGSGTQPQSPPALRKGAAPNAGMTYVPAASSSDMSERHMDAGPAGGSSLQRNASGRLPPAYGDLVRG